jgi:ElaB/YqjD/DUF883 family membrane-anchored ribosome-binding protein
MDNDRNAPATRGDMQDLEARLEARLQGLEARQNERHEMLRAEMGHSFDDLKETIRDTQTGLLKAFYSYTQSTDLKLSDSAASDANLRERLSVVERRITELERKVGFPDHPTQ